MGDLASRMASGDRNLNVAIVEDDRSLSRALSRFLRASGYFPFSFDSAEAFLAETGSPDFLCMVVDIQLDGMSGIELAEHLAATGGSTAPVVFLTASDQADELEIALRGHCAAFIRKSEQGAKLLAAIDSIAHA